MRSDRKRKKSLQASRPSIPIPCSLAVALAIGVFLEAPLAECFPALLSMGVLIALCGALAAALLVAFFTKRALRWWIVSFFLIGLVVAGSQQALLAQERQDLREHPDSSTTYEFVLDEDSKPSAHGTQMSVTIATGQRAGNKVLVFAKGAEQYYGGERIVAETRLEVPGEDYREYYDRRGIALRASIGEHQVLENDSGLSVIYQLRKRLLNIVGTGSDEQTFLRAILLGERSGLFDAEFYHSIKVAGLAHLVAVSGAHLVIVSGFVALILRWFRVSAKVAVGTQTIFLLVYLILVGFPISCIRAAIMSGIALVALIARRRSSSLAALGIAVIVMMVLDPCVVHQLSFQLSVAATLGIIIFMPLLNDWFAHFAPRVPDSVRESICMTLSALIFSLPISAATFSMVPLLSPLANLIATPYLSVLLVFGFAALLLCSVLPFLLEALAVLTGGLLTLFSFVEAIPTAALPVSIGLDIALPLALFGALILWSWWPTPRHHRKRALFLACTSMLVLCAFVGMARVMPMGDRIVMLDVGQGDSFVLSSGGRTLLVDTGNETEMLYAALARNNITSLDAALITHPDDDHCGSLAALSGVVEIKRIIIAEDLDEVADDKVEHFISLAHRIVDAQDIVEVGRGDSLVLGSFTLDVVAPDHVEHEGGNEDSICFYARIDCDRDGLVDWNAFFCGDAEAEVLEELDDEHLLEPVDIYKVGHHGSRKAITPELASTLAPKVALIGVGENSYGHPTEETLETLERVGSKVFRSDLQGDVICSIAPDAIEVSSQRSFV